MTSTIVPSLPKGRRRDPNLDEAIFDATLAMFAEGGYRNVSIEGVAARAGVGKATIYRRHPTKAALVVDAVRERLCVLDELPDTGDVRADLLAMMQPLVDRLRSADGPMMVALMSERTREPELAAEYDRSIIGRKRVHMRNLLTRAVASGVLAPETDIDLVAEAIPALIWHHALHHLTIDEEFAARVVDNLVLLQRVQN